MRAKSPAAGHSATWRFSARTKNMPATAINTSGSSFATVIAVLSRTPSVTPRMLTHDQNPNATTRIAACIALPDNAGSSSPMLNAITDDTAAVANTPIIHNSTPERNPA